ncbi:MAG TPA: FtsX-like permease family protein [Actinomycetes bacterium]|nr:FtsX-like permease family protein [Actinomycetes bacterium]
MTGWRAALRVARREARRARGRSILVIAMIGLPVAALAFVAVAQDTFTLTPDERADRLMGTGQAVVVWPSDGPVQQLPTHLHAVLPAGPAGASSKTAAPTTPPGVERLLALLPPGTRAIADQTGVLAVHTAAGIGNLRARMLDVADPLARGILRPRSGRAPASTGEVALTPAAARRVGVGVGGDVRLAEGGRSFRVVGIVEDPEDLDATTIVLRPGALPPAALSGDRQDHRWLVATAGPLTWAQVKQLNTHGLAAVSRHVLAHPPGPAEGYPEFDSQEGPQLGVAALVGGLAVLEVVLLAGPAFAVGARRRRRDLALVAAAGGSPAQLRRIVLADGLVLGTVAAAGGVALGIATATAARPLLEGLSNLRSGGFRVFPEALAGLAGLAVATGVLAALVPAWIAARQDVVAALAGRRGITRSRRRWPIVGAVLVAAGALVAATGARRANATIILAGLAVVELGLVLCTPAFVGLVARVGHLLPVAPRIALRDTARNRTAAAPAIAAGMAAVAGSLAVGVVLLAGTGRARDDYRVLGRPGDVFVYGVNLGTDPSGGQAPVPRDVVAALRGIMPVRQLHEIGVPSCDTNPCLVTPQVSAARQCPYAPAVLRRDPTPAEQRAARRDARCDGVNRRSVYFGGGISSDTGLTLIIDAATTGALVDVAAEDADRAATALRAGAVVVDDPRYLDDGRVTLAIPTSPFSKDDRMVAAPGFAFPHPPRAPTITLMTRQTARTLGLGYQPLAALATTSRIPTVAEQDRLRAALDEFGRELGMHVERGPRAGTSGLVVLAVVAGVVTLGAAAIATGLAAADGRADLSTLAAVGASPRVRRALSLSQSGVIAGLGSLLGAVAGLGTATAVLVALNRGYADVWPAPTPYPIAVPWGNVGVALLVVPLVAMLGAGLLTRSRLPIERRL